MSDGIIALIGPRPREALLDELVRGVGLPYKLLVTVAAMVAGAALYGAALGLWRGGAQVVYAAIKLPLVLLVTAALTMVFNWMAAVLFGLRLRFVQVAVLSFLALGVAAVVLASLAPVAWLFSVSAPEPSPEARTTHNLLYLLHVVLVAAAGLTGMAVLWRTLENLATEGRTEGRSRARRIFAAWILSFALVGGEVAWALRPFVGSIYYPPAFLRPDALDGNVYEFVARDVVPHLLFGREPTPNSDRGGDRDGRRDP